MKKEDLRGIIDGLNEALPIMKEESLPWYERVLELLADIFYWPFVRLHARHWYRFKYACQRFSRGYDDSAQWNLNDAIADIVIPVLLKMEKDRVGYPSSKTDKQWGIELKKMRLGFQAFKDERDSAYLGYSRKGYEKLEKIQKEGLKLFAENFDSLWD